MTEPPKTKPKRTPIPQTQVLQWLADNHPTLHAVAEVERSWVWLPVDLRGDEPTRKSIKEFGFIFARNGGHALPSGKMGNWGHSCTAPLPFYRKSKAKRTTSGEPTNHEPQPDADAEALAFAGLA